MRILPQRGEALFSQTYLNKMFWSLFCTVPLLSPVCVRVHVGAMMHAFRSSVFYAKRLVSPCPLGCVHYKMLSIFQSAINDVLQLWYFRNLSFSFLFSYVLLYRSVHLWKTENTAQSSKQTFGIISSHTTILTRNFDRKRITSGLMLSL